VGGKKTENAAKHLTFLSFFCANFSTDGSLYQTFILNLKHYRSTLIFVSVLFVLSRGVVALGLLAGEQYLPMPEGEFWHSEHPLNVFARWDSGWYSTIVKNGYQIAEDYSSQQNVVFFPLYPLLVKALVWLTGWHWITSGVVISHAAFGMALLLFYRFLDRIADQKTAKLGTALMAFSPYGVFFSVVYTESLFLLCFVAMLYFWRRQRLIVSGMAAGFASATRLHGVLLALPFALMAIKCLYRYRRLPDWRILLGGGLSVLGAVGFMGYLYSLSGDWLLIPKLQNEAWNHATFSPGQLINTFWRELTESLYYLPALQRGEIGLMLLARRFDVWALVVSIVLTGYLFVKSKYEEWLWLAPAMMALNLYALSGSFVSLGRYLSVLPMLYFGLALSLSRFSVWIGWAIVGICAFVMVLFSSLFGGWYWAG